MALGGRWAKGISFIVATFLWLRIAGIRASVQLDASFSGTELLSISCWEDLGGLSSSKADKLWILQILIRFFIGSGLQPLWEGLIPLSGQGRRQASRYDRTIDESSTGRNGPMTVRRSFKRFDILPFIFKTDIYV